jgi:hypothetical protein
MSNAQPVIVGVVVPIELILTMRTGARALISRRRSRPPVVLQFLKIIRAA